MAISVEAVYEDGVLKPSEPLPLRERERVRLTVEPERGTRTLIPCEDPELIERVALDAELEFEQ